MSWVNPFKNSFESCAVFKLIESKTYNGFLDESQKSCPGVGFYHESLKLEMSISNKYSSTENSSNKSDMENPASFQAMLVAFAWKIVDILMRLNGYSNKCQIRDAMKWKKRKQLGFLSLCEGWTNNHFFPRKNPDIT